MENNSKPFGGAYVAPWIVAQQHPDWDKVLHLGHPLSWGKKQVVHELGRPPLDIILVRKGLMCILAMSHSGDQRNIGILGPGSLVGDVSLFCGEQNHHTIRTVVPSEGVLFNKNVVMQEILPKFSTLAAYICTNIATKSYVMSTQLECSTFMSGEQKIAHFLYHLAMEQKKNSELYQQVADLSLVGISELLGMHRVTVTNEINNFKRMGILEVGAEKLRIMDTGALLHILHSSR